VIGLVAAKLVQEYYLPSIVISEGEVMSKASARSIPGFSIIDAIRAHNHLIEGGGGHTMAAGFSIKTNKIEIFEKKIGDYSAKLLDDKLLKRKLRVDLEIGFNKINRKLVSRLNDFEPTGIGNPAPTVATYDVQVLESRVVGRDSKHIKLVLTKDDVVFEAIAFGFGDYYSKLLPQSTIDVLYTIEENIWRGKRSIQLKIKDIKPKNYGKK
jgi:single-stranded-DNA-specific exonuclease